MLVCNDRVDFLRIHDHLSTRSGSILEEEDHRGDSIVSTQPILSGVVLHPQYDAIPKLEIGADYVSSSFVDLKLIIIAFADVRVSPMVPLM